ncbi:hypothetical protein C8R48DRAFT_671107 [Suillus tomentosus]|nr:hypothetical protein C8R48DRAFT_671107 [Suillus tomentosus]
MFDYAGGFNELRMNLDFACYMLAGTSIGPCHWPADVAMTTDPPIGYIAMNDHSGPLVVELNFSTKLAPWPMGFPWQPAFNTDMSFDGATYSHLTDYTVGSHDSQLGYFNVIPSPGTTGPSPSPSIPSQDLMQPSGLTSAFSEELSWPANMKPILEHVSLCQTVILNLTLDNPWTTVIRWLKICIIGSLVAVFPGGALQERHVVRRFGIGSRDALPLAPFERTGNTFIVYLLNNWLTFDDQFNHKPNTFASDWRKVIGHCLQPGEYMGFCQDQDQLRTRTSRMLAALETQLVSNSADYDVIAEIIGLQMAKEIWHHIILRPVVSNPSISISDIYWDQILDQQGNVSLEVVAFIVCLFYEWCQKTLNVILNRTAAANVILIYKRILRLKGPPQDKIQSIAKDLSFIRDINVYGVDKDGRYKRQTLGPVIRTPVRIPTFQLKFPVLIGYLWKCRRDAKQHVWTMFANMSKLEKCRPDHVMLVNLLVLALFSNCLFFYSQMIYTVSQTWIDDQSLRTYRHAPSIFLWKAWAAVIACSVPSASLFSSGRANCAKALDW